jgi:VWFA-related protein
MKPNRRVHLSLLFAAIVSLTVFLEPIRAQQQEPADDVIKVNADLVVFDAQVIDKKSKRVIGDLAKDDFQITEDGIKQTVTYFSRDELPLSIMLLLDVSGSVRPILNQIRDGALNALQRLKPDDQVAVMAFANTSALVQDFTKDRALVSRKIEEATATDKLGKGTLLGPALESAAIKMNHSPTPTSRRVIIVVTDNVAITSGQERKDVLAELFESGTVVYGLIVKAAIGKAFNILFLGQLKGVNDFVEQTGGEILGADKKEVDTRLAMVIDRLRSRYAGGYRPTNTSDEGKFRQVRINVDPRKKRDEKPVVLTRRGYYLRRK